MRFFESLPKKHRRRKTLNILNASKRISGAYCTVLGYGISNKPLVEWLLSHGAGKITVRDKRSKEEMEASGDLERLISLGVECYLGADYLAGL